MTRAINLQDAEIWLVCSWEKLLFALAKLFCLALPQVLRMAQVAPSGLFLVTRTNFWTSYIGREAMGRHRKHFLEMESVQSCGPKVNLSDSF